MNPPTKDPNHTAQCQPRTGRSRTIPLPSSHIARTQSELQLSEDMAAAEWKDLCMFYRVVGGIREQQQQRACSARTNGAPIHTHEQLQQRQPQHTIQERKPKPIRDWTGKDVSSTVDAAARVTPFDPCSEASPPSQGTFPPYPRSLLLRSPKRRSSDGGWSITGFDEDSSGASPLALIERDTIEDEAVFVMDL